MCVDELKRYLLLEKEDDALVQLPNNIFQIAHSLVKEAREEIPECEQVCFLFCLNCIILGEISNTRFMG